MTTSRRPRPVDEDDLELPPGTAKRGPAAQPARRPGSRAGSRVVHGAPRSTEDVRQRTEADPAVGRADSRLPHADADQAADVDHADPRGGPADGVVHAEAPAEPREGADPAPAKPAKRPLYPRLLRLRHITPNAWQRAALGEGAVGVGVLLAMADLATAWSIVALPVAVAVVVKAHDALQGLLDGAGRAPAEQRPPAEGAARAEQPDDGPQPRGRQA